MKTRNQLNSKVVPEANNNATSQPEDTSLESLRRRSPPRRSPPLLKRSPSPLQLRDSRSLSVEGKQNSPSINPPNTNPHQAPGPPLNIKRPSGPTRILPRRSCAASSLLLSSCMTASSCYFKTPRQTTSKSPDVTQTSPTKDTQHQPVTSTSQAQQPNGVASSIDTELSPINVETANIKNYSRDVPPTSKNILPLKTTKSSGSSLLKSNEINTKLVRISLPDETRLDANNPIDMATNSNQQSDKNMYMFTTNGLRKIGSVSPDKTKNEIADNADSLSDAPLLDGVSQVSTSVKKKTFNVLLAVTGSVAAIKLVELTRKIESTFPKTIIDKMTGDKIESSVSIKIVMTKNSMHFALKDQIQTDLAHLKVEIFEDSDEWSSWKKMGDPVLHIELRKWADLCLIAPLDANTMAKLANGICDNLLTCIVRAWDISKPLVYCPAMNVHMYNHPITREQLSKLQSYNYLQVNCVEKRLACGDVGIGGMASVDTIAQKVIDCLVQPISRKVSLIRPLLNQPPTYPIISTSGHTDGVSRAVMPTIFDRFRKNNQISIHAVPTSNMQSVGVSLLQRNERFNPNSSDDNDLAQSYSGYSNNFHHSNSNQTNGSRNKMGGVTSVQNLKAMGVDNGTMDVERELLDNNNGRIELDPSKLLEQSMVTDDYASSSFQDDSFERNVTSVVESNFGITADITPRFNASKFLALCSNKDRGDFTCAVCKHDYKNRKSMSRHLKEQHVQGNIFQCKPCGVSYKRREKLIKHNREHHPEKI